MKSYFRGRYFKLIFGSALLLFNAACCTHPQTPTTYPATVRGWQSWNERGVPFIGELVLRKGEASGNGRIGVKVLEIRQGKAACGFSRDPIEPDVTLSFYKVSDPTITCAITTGTGGRLLQCDERLELNTLGVLAINATEGWVHFRLG
jgi:hypothetical protein